MRYLITILSLFIFGCTGTIQDDLLDLRSNNDSSVKMTFPTSNDYISNKSKLVLTGNSTNQYRLKSIEIQVNGGQWQLASTGSSFSHEITLEIGKNEVIVRGTNDKDMTIENSPIYIHYLWEKRAELPIGISHADIVVNPTSKEFYIIGGLYRSTLFKYKDSVLTEYPQLNRISFNAVTFFYNNFIYVMGGFENTSNKKAVTSFHKYNLDNTSSSAVTIENKYYRAGAAYTEDDQKVYIVGGYDYLGEIKNTVLIYTKSNNSFVEYEFPKSLIHSSTILKNNKLYIFGGYDQYEGYLNSIYTFDLSTNQATLLDSERTLSTARSKINAVIVEDKVYLIGGEVNSQDSNIVEVLDLSTKQIKVISKAATGMNNSNCVNINNTIFSVGNNNNEINKEILQFHFQNDTLN